MPWFSAPVAGLALVAGLLPTPVSSALAAAAMLRGLEGWTVSPLHTIGEAIGDYVPVGKPDGIGAFRRGDGRVRILVNHELWRSRGASYRLRNDVELIGARISYFDVDARSRTIVTAGIATASVFDRARQPVTAASQVSELPDGRTIGFGRFCSGQAVAAGTFGLVDDVYFVGEEVRPPRGHPFGGSVWALDVATGALWAVPAMGRGAWENVTPLATGDAGRVAFLLRDDTREAPLYLYVGTKRDGGFLERNGLAQGRLYVWRADAGDLSAETFHGTGSRRAGRFVEIEIFSSVGYIDHPAQHAAARAVGAFRFARPEDLATDPRNPRRAVFASTGGNDRWGTIYLIDIDFAGDEISATLTIPHDASTTGDHGPRNPDNLDWADDGAIYVQEDPTTDGFGDASGREASIWRLDPDTGAAQRIAEVDRAAALSGGTEDTKVDKFGAWETSGVLDVTDLFDTAQGETLLLGTVQAHGVKGGVIDRLGLDEGGQIYFLSR